MIRNRETDLLQKCRGPGNGKRGVAEEGEGMKIKLLHRYVRATTSQNECDHHAPQICMNKSTNMKQNVYIFDFMFYNRSHCRY